MVDVWYPKATRYQVGDPGSYTGGGVKRCTLHTTENTPESTSAMDVCSWMKANKAGSVYHLIYHPITGEVVQMLPVSGSAKSLSNPSGGVETNKAGSIHIQVSVVARASDPFTKYPMPGWSALVDWITAHGVPRKWVGNPLTNAVDHVTNDYWNKTSGWYGHCCVPENTHHDPGKVDLNKVLGAGSSVPAPKPPSGGTAAPAFPYPSNHYLGLESPKPECHSGYYSADRPHIETWQARMAQRGWKIGVDGRYGSESDGVCRKFQAEKGLAVDGLVGPKTWSTSWTAPIT